MLIADGNVVLPVVIGIACVIVLGVGALYLFRGYERLARRSLERRYAGLQLHEAPVSGDVIVTYHTYHGFIAWFTQIPHEVALPPNDARKLLGRLLRFNLMWGLVTYGALFIPPLSIISYFAQRRSIDEQEAGGGVAVGAGTDIPLEEVATSERVSNEDGVAAPSLFHRVVGWTAAFLCGVFVINAVVCLLRAEFGIAIGSTVFALLVRWAARDWLGKGRRSMT